ncbi:MAG: hypothetical protein AB1791_18365 [Chloroflexota bacterium]
MTDVDLSGLSIEGVAGRCRRETESFRAGRPYSPDACYELFRRALAEPHRPASEAAWAFVHEQYREQASRWASHDPLFYLAGESAEDIGASALTRMWVAFANHPGKFDSGFPPDNKDRRLRELLDYLKSCVQSAVKGEFLPDWDEVTDELPDRNPWPEEADFVGGDLFTLCVEPRLHNEKEKLVMDATYVYDLKPREIYAENPAMFESAKEISRILENVKERFKRDETLQDCLKGE